MELGGKTPVIVSAGRTCVCASHHIVHVAIYDRPQLVWLAIATLRILGDTQRIGDRQPLQNRSSSALVAEFAFRLVPQLFN